ENDRKIILDSVTLLGYRSAVSQDCATCALRTYPSIKPIGASQGETNARVRAPKAATGLSQTRANVRSGRRTHHLHARVIGQWPLSLRADCRAAYLDRVRFWCEQKYVPCSGGAAGMGSLQATTA